MDIKYLDSVPKRILFALLLIFISCCFRLCAQDITPAQAQVTREKFVAESKKYVGCRYVLGGVGPDTFDCSGLIYYVARQAIQVQLPRTSRALYSYCRIVPDDKREIGDLLFFKTNNSAPITHVGIYIGNSQFISAISDGPNSGVIISSLNQPYWKPKYVACGQFIKSGRTSKRSDTNSVSDYEFEEEEFDESSVEKLSKSSNVFFDSLVADAAIFCDWAFISPDSFMLQFRGVDIQSNVKYTDFSLQPGIGFAIRYNHGVGIFQIPILFSTTPNDFVRIYAGPVFSVGTARMINSGDEISLSIFPGILGVSFSTPYFNIAHAKVQVVQDISYTVFNKADNSALPFVQSVAAGLVFCTGIRVSIGLKSFLR